MLRKINRRSFLKSAAGSSVAAAAAHNGFWLMGHAETSSGQDLTKEVNVFLGTGGHGHTYPGATMPFGAVQLSPDTGTSGWYHSSGYHYDDRSILGFSHTHLSGTGVGDLMDFLIMPSTGVVRTQPGDADQPGSGYRSTFSHQEEKAEPGYYSVVLQDSGVIAELTATTRVGFHRYQFPSGDSNHLVVDLAHGFVDTPDDLPTKTGRSKILSAELHLVGNDTVTGGRRCAQWGNGREIFFAMKVSRPFSKSEIVVDEKPFAVNLRDAEGKSIQCVLHYPMESAGSLLVKVGISAVSMEGAMKNLESEVPGWDFDGVRGAAKAAWQNELARIVIDSEDPAQSKTFYTAMYHAMVAPTTFDDVDGKYRGMDSNIHQLAAGARNYTTYSLWDTYRSLHPLYTLVQRERLPEMMNTLIRMAEQSPEGVPVWPLQGVETGCMIGFHSAVVIAEAHAKDIPGIDYGHAYQLWRKRAFAENYRGLSQYRALGFIACDKEPEAVSKTLEYAYDDWAMAHLASAAGAESDAQLLRARSRNYKNVFDRSITFVRGRFQNGDWADPFDPRGMGHSKAWRDFTESNSWEATFLNQHDINQYMGLFGGDQPFVRKLDRLFHQSSELPPDAPLDMSGMVGQYSQGNEPDHHVAYLYAYAGKPYKTQELVRSLMTSEYRDAPDGLAGNEDCGQMSAWYVMSALGLYAVDPVSGNYIFGSPLFKKATLELGGGKKLVIDAVNNGPNRPYLKSVKWKGMPYSRSWIQHEDLMTGATLVLEMSETPNELLGSEDHDKPPSFV